MAILAPFFIISSRIILSDSIVLKLEDDLLNGCDGLHSLLHINFRKVRALILGNTLHLKNWCLHPRRSPPYAGAPLADVISRCILCFAPSIVLITPSIVQSKLVN